MHLTGHRRRTPWRILAHAILLGAVAFVWVTGLVSPLAGGAGPAEVRAATPSASPAVGGDTRSAGEGPGLVGSPILAIFGVLGIGLASAAVTLLYVRLTSERSTRSAAAGRAVVPAADKPESG